MKMWCAEAHPTCATLVREWGRRSIISRYAEAGEGAVGKPPGGLGNIGIGFLPGFVEGGAPAAIQFGGRLVESSALENRQIALHLAAPFAGVAEHVVEAPGVGLL